jgi:glyoxylase-like metal-dependent hydrolase (beta-lactamase superfamily II)
VSTIARSTIAFLLAVLIVLSFGTADAQSKFRGIKHITGDLYQVQDDNNTFTAFLVTREGIILTDPINERSAIWLKEELRKRFDLPVKYLIYSHNHDGHSPGAAIYDDAIIIGQENIVPIFEIWNDLSVRYDEFEGFDGDREKFEAYRAATRVEFPDVTFRKRMSIKLGGKQVNLLAMGLGHGEDSLFVHYPECFDALRRLEAIDFDILLVGHGIHGTGAGAIGNKEDVTEFREYNEALYAGILEARAAGLTREQAMQNIELPAFSHLGMYDEWLQNNISSMWRYVDERK